MDSKKETRSSNHPSDEVYPNSPLIEVIFELRFPGNLDVECQRHMFWQKVRNDYPRLLVPRAKPEGHLALEPYRFEQADGQAGVLLSLNRFGLYSKKYRGFKRFKEEFQRVRDLFGAVFKLDTLLRTGWRYINLIPFAREDGLVPLDQYLTLGFKVPDSIPERFRELKLVFTSKGRGGIITTRLETVANPEGQEAFILDFDYGKEESLKFADVDDYLDEAHSVTRKLFEELITDSYRQYLRGDVL